MPPGKIPKLKLNQPMEKQFSQFALNIKVCMQPPESITIDEIRNLRQKRFGIII
jgi:hypothetical protein